PVRRPLQQVPDEWAADAEAEHHEPVDPEVVHQAELVVGEGVPRPVDLERAERLAVVGVAQVQCDAAVRVRELFQRIERRLRAARPASGQRRDRRVEAAARQDQQRKAGPGFLVMKADGTAFAERHYAPPLSCVPDTLRKRHPNPWRSRMRPGAKAATLWSRGFWGCLPRPAPENMESNIREEGQMGEGTGRTRCVALVGPYLSGKTALLESMLHAAGAIPRKGTANESNRVGDAAPEARERKMSVEIVPASFEYLGDRWTILDCPGSIEFAQDACNACMVADLAVVVCDPEPERAMTVAPLLRFLDEHSIPHLLFINKLDAANDRVREILSALQGVSQRPLVLRQVPIREGEAVTGYVDLISERA